MASDTDYGPALRGGRPRTPRRFGLPARRRRPSGSKSRRRTALRVALALLGVLIVLAVVVPTMLFFTMTSRMETVPVATLSPGDGGPTNVLIVGSDSREGMTREEQLDLRTGSVGGNLTDTIMLASMQGGQAALLAFPRDLWVTRCDGSVGRINAAVGVGGPGCLVETIQQLSGLPVHHYMEVRFLGFRDLVDALGGVELCLEQPIDDPKAGIDLPAGCQILDGSEALGYVRTRAIDNDLGRIGRQQEFLKALARKGTARSTLVDVPGLFDVAGAAGDSLRASDSVGAFTLGRIAWGLRGLAGGAPTYTVPGSPARISGAAVLEPVMEEARPLFERFRTGAVLAESTGEDALTPQDVTVAVLNGAGVGGLAGSVADELESRGFTIARVGNAEPLARTVVRYPQGQEAEAALVAAQSPVAGVPTEEAVVDVVTLVLGADAGGG